MGLKPVSTPKLAQAAVLRNLVARGVTEKTAILAVRGFYSSADSKGENKRAVYDDALFLVGPTFFGAFNANTDPGAYRRGHGRGSAKGMASLKPGTYRVHKIDLHNGAYEALCQRAGDVTVYRDADVAVSLGDTLVIEERRVYEDTGSFGINIHRGGFNTTSSAGCQTIWPEQWPYFIDKAKEQLKQAGQKVMPYCLVVSRALVA